MSHITFCTFYGTSPDVFAAKYNVVPLLQETKNKLSQVTQKLKESREEGLQIRADCQAMIKQYQVRFYWQSFHLMSLKDVFTFMCMYIVSVLLTSLPLPLPKIRCIIDFSVVAKSEVTVVCLSLLQIIVHVHVCTHSPYFIISQNILIPVFGTCISKGIRRNEVKLIG